MSSFFTKTVNPYLIYTEQNANINATNNVQVSTILFYYEILTHYKKTFTTQKATKYKGRSLQEVTTSGKDKTTLLLSTFFRFKRVKSGYNVS